MFSSTLCLTYRAAATIIGTMIIAMGIMETTDMGTTVTNMILNKCTLTASS